MRNLIKSILKESLLLFEDEKHVRQLFTSWANKKSGNPELALSLMDDFFKYQKKIKRDFTSFKSAEEMKQAVDNALQSDVEKQKYSDAIKIFENSDLLVVAANTHEASCRYAKGTKWCTGASKTDEYWKRHNRTGTEFIWILKGLKQTNPNYKFSLHFKWSKNIKMTQSPSQKFDSDWCNAQNNCSSRIPNTLLTILGEDSFDNIFDKCMDYHGKRGEEKIKKIANPNVLQQKLITLAKEKLPTMITDSYEFSVNDEVNNLTNELENNLDYDYDEIEVISKEHYDFLISKFNQVLTNIVNIVTQDIQNMDSNTLVDEFSRFIDSGEYDTEQQSMEFFSDEYLSIQSQEILYEEISMLNSEFLDIKGIENFF